MVISDLQYLEVIGKENISQPTPQVNTTHIKGGLVVIAAFAASTVTAQDFSLSQVTVGTFAFTFPVL